MIAPRRLLATALLASAVTGCRFGSTEPDDRPTAASLFVNVTVPATFRADTNIMAYVSANLMAGRDARGAPREVTAPLQLGGRALTFAGPLDRFGSRFIEQTSVRLTTGLGRQPLSLDPPPIAELTPNRTALRISTVRALDADTIRPAADGALRITLAVAAGDAAATMRNWVLNVSGTQTLIYRGSGLPPAELVVPRDLLPPATPAGQWRVQLDFQEGHGVVFGPQEPVAQPAAYDVRVLFQQLVFWTALRN